MKTIMFNKNLVAAASVALGLGAGVMLWTQSVQAQSSPRLSSPTTVSAPLVKGLPDFTALVDAVGPSVVNIRTMARVRPQAEQMDGNMDPEMQEFFRRFFGAPFPGAPQQPQPRRRGGQGDGELRPSGVGSGFILTADGFVMTNAHVVEGADEVLVTLADKRELKAKVVGLDKRSDVAVVKVPATALPALKVGDVGQLKVGEWVIAIGSPFGLENTVTAGIVSAKQRDTGDYLPFIQTDVAINPGNSGGPLINMRGEVVGINSQIYSRSGGYMGISFSIPMDEAMRVSDQIRAQGHVTRGRVGVQIDQVSPEVAESIGLGKARGAMVRMVESGGPAEKAGLQAGDIILEFDGKPIDKASDLPRIVGNTRPGTKAEMQVYRRGAQRKLTVTVGELPGEKAPAETHTGDEQATTSNVLGLTVTNLSAEQKKKLRVEGGVRVAAVQGAGARAGLREGDVVLAVGNKQVLQVADFNAAVSTVEPGKIVSVLVRRAESVQYVLVRTAR